MSWLVIKEKYKRRFYIHIKYYICIYIYIHLYKDRGEGDRDMDMCVCVCVLECLYTIKGPHVSLASLPLISNLTRKSNQPWTEMTMIFRICSGKGLCHHVGFLRGNNLKCSQLCFAINMVHYNWVFISSVCDAGVLESITNTTTVPLLRTSCQARIIGGGILAAQGGKVKCDDAKGCQVSLK